MESKTVWNALDASPEIAWESPLEKGVFHYPAGSVDKKPPKFDSETQSCAWSGKKWVVSCEYQSNSNFKSHLQNLDSS